MARSMFHVDPTLFYFELFSFRWGWEFLNLDEGHGISEGFPGRRIREAKKRGKTTVMINQTKDR
jgi:hypothetical protein